MGRAAQNKRVLEEKLVPWTPFEEAFIPMTAEQLALSHKIRFGMSDLDAAVTATQLKNQKIWKNSRYQVNVEALESLTEGLPEMLWLMIKRLDQKPLGKEHFRDLQRIKNEIVGPECEGVELYPAESRLVDVANTYHLFVMHSTRYRWPFGLNQRGVDPNSVGGAVQEPFERDYPTTYNPEPEPGEEGGSEEDAKRQA